MSRPLLLGAVAAAVAWSAPALAPVAPPVARALGLPRRLSDPGTVAITFDDGPHPLGTPAVLEALRDAGATATFFLVGEQVERGPGLAAEIAAAGHAIAVHGHRHRNMLRLTPRQVADDLDRGVTAIGEASGTLPTVYRPPYGIFSPAGLAIVARRALRPLLWSRWGHDWRGGAGARGIASEVADGVRGKDVLLLHDADHYNAPGSWRATVAALPAVLAKIDAAGLRARAL
jgi:peptidoglycan/xylan/chitin deacetylase (PgdA/CDA1 family)